MANKIDTNSLISGGIAGAGAAVGARFLGPSIGPAAGTAVAAYVKKDAWAMHMAGYQLGTQVATGALQTANVPGASAPAGGFL